jgi:hypothetical protein
MHNPQRVITLRNTFNQDTNGTNVIELIEAQVFTFHFSINRINVFYPPANFSLNAMLIQSARNYQSQTEYIAHAPNAFHSAASQFLYSDRVLNNES